MLRGFIFCGMNTVIMTVMSVRHPLVSPNLIKVGQISTIQIIFNNQVFGDTKLFGMALIKEVSFTKLGPMS